MCVLACESKGQPRVLVLQASVPCFNETRSCHCPWGLLIQLSCLVRKPKSLPVPVLGLQVPATKLCVLDDADAND